MEEDDGIERYIKGKEKEEAIEWIREAMLWIGKEGIAGKLVGIPQGEIAPFDAFHPEESWRDEVGTQIPFGEEVSSAEKVIKKEKGGKEKGQAAKDIGQSDPLHSSFYLIDHNKLTG